MNLLNKATQKEQTMASTVLKSSMAAMAVTAALFAVSCSDTGDKPVYESTPERLYLGSIYYAKKGCAECHGAEWDGTGPQAKEMKAQGLTPTSFTSAPASEKTPLSYFKALTNPSEYFQGASATVADQHKTLDFTDRGRWALANFLFQMGPAAEDSAAHSEAMDKMMEEVTAVYAENRRWTMGFPAVSERTPKPEFSSMIEKTSTRPAEEMDAPAAVSDARKSVSLEAGRGSDIYRGSCMECHGRYAEGRRDRYGLIGMIPIESGYPRVQELKRQEAVFFTTPDLARSSALGSKESFKNAHKDENLLAPGMTAFTGEDWTALYNYTRRLAGK